MQIYQWLIFRKINSSDEGILRKETIMTKHLVRKHCKNVIILIGLLTCIAPMIWIFINQNGLKESASGLLTPLGPDEQSFLIRGQLIVLKEDNHSFRSKVKLQKTSNHLENRFESANSKVISNFKDMATLGRLKHDNMKISMENTKENKETNDLKHSTVGCDLFYPDGSKNDKKQTFKFSKPHVINHLNIEFNEDVCNNATTFEAVRKLIPTPGRLMHDVIVEQINHVPLGFNDDSPSKTIYLVGRPSTWNNVPEGDSVFQGCKVNRCKVTYDRSVGYKAEAVLFNNPFALPGKLPFKKSSPSQIWAMNILESPLNTRSLVRYNNYINWTMTYREDSVLPTPYTFYKKNSDVVINKNQSINYAAGKTKMAAWFVSNCLRVSSGRQTYAKELKKHVEVDIFGRCGSKKCPRKEESKCLDMIKSDYKFYLAFENTKCFHYLTEKVLKGFQ